MAALMQMDHFVAALWRSRSRRQKVRLSTDEGRKPLIERSGSSHPCGRAMWLSLWLPQVAAALLP
jgi:hypothetical protein